jgi:hypothetical protein
MIGSGQMAVFGRHEPSKASPTKIRTGGIAVVDISRH